MEDTNYFLDKEFELLKKKLYKKVEVVLMKNRIKLIFMVCLIFSFSLSGCANSNNKVISEVGSPDGKYNAFYFIRDLGATTKASSQLTVLKKGKKLGDTVGNVFVTYGEFDVEWENDNMLVVNIKKDEEIFKQLTKYKDIEIKYKKH